MELFVKENSLMLSIQSLEKTYKTKKDPIHALKGINLDLKPNEIYCLVGRSGSGKTTLMKCLNLFERPTSGNIILNHKDITHSSDKELYSLRREISIIFQDACLISNKNVYDNVGLPLDLIKTPKSQKTELMHSALSITHLIENRTDYPNKLTSCEKIKVALARAIVSQPKIIVCDEITTKLDNKATRSILEILKYIHETLGITILMLTHEIEAIKHLCNRVGILHQGKLVEETTPLELFLNPKSSSGKDLISSITRLEMPSSLRRKMQPTAFKKSDPILRIVFKSEVAQEPLFAHLIQQFNLSINIIQAYQDDLQGSIVHVMLLEVTENIANIEPAKKFLLENQVYSEVIGYVPSTT
jgi:D-methionine transport system ATP-binding protein